MSHRKPILRSPEGFLQTSVALVGLFVVELEIESNLDVVFLFELQCSIK